MVLDNVHIGTEAVPEPSARALELGVPALVHPRSLKEPAEGKDQRRAPRGAHLPDRYVGRSRLRRYHRRHLKDKKSRAFAKFGGAKLVASPRS